MKLSKMGVLSQSEMEKVHSESLRILEHAGVCVEDQECREILVRAGAKTDPGGDTVYLPGQLIEESLKMAPDHLCLHRQDGTTVPIGVNSSLFGSLVIDPWIIDYQTQRPRRPVLEDVIHHTRLGDALDAVGFMYRMDMLPDNVSVEHANIRTLEAFAINTSKPMLAAPSSVESLYDWLELIDILADGHPLNERMRVMFSAPVTTPLFFHSLNSEIVKAGVRRGLPMCAQTEPIAGSTAPLSFAGGLLMGNCENLFLVVMAQLLNPGTPIAYSVGNGLTDLQTGHALFYPAEKMLWKIASSQMAKFYCLPIEGEATGSMVGRYDTQNGIEQTLHMLPSVTYGGGMFNGLGSCYNACAMSAEMIVIHADLLGLLTRLELGVDVSDEKLDADAIIENGPRGHFLEDPLTIKMLRSNEFYAGDCFDRLGERSPNRFEDSMLARAHNRVEDLLSMHTCAVPDRVCDNVRQWANNRCSR